LKLLRVQAPAILITAALAGFAGKQSLLDIIAVTLTLFLLALGLWSIDDYVDRDVDRIVHPGRAIVSGLLDSSTVLKAGVLSLALSLSVSSTRIFIKGDFILPALVTLYIVLGLIAINVHKIVGSRPLQTVIKMTIVASLIGLVLPTAGGFGEKMVSLGLIVGLLNLGSTIILDYMDSISCEEFSVRLTCAGGIIYLLGSIIVWIPYFLGVFEKTCATPIFGLSLCSLTLSIICFTRKVNGKVKVVSALGALFVFWILIIWATSP